MGIGRTVGIISTDQARGKRGGAAGAVARPQLREKRVSRLFVEDCNAKSISVIL